MRHIGLVSALLLATWAHDARLAVRDEKMTGDMAGSYGTVPCLTPGSHRATLSAGEPHSRLESFR